MPKEGKQSTEDMQRQSLMTQFVLLGLLLTEVSSGFLVVRVNVFPRLTPRCTVVSHCLPRIFVCLFFFFFFHLGGGGGGIGDWTQDLFLSYYPVLLRWRIKYSIAQPGLELVIFLPQPLTVLGCAAGPGKRVLTTINCKKYKSKIQTLPPYGKSNKEYEQIHSTNSIIAVFWVHRDRKREKQTPIL